MIEANTATSETTINTYNGRKFTSPGMLVIGSLLTSDCRVLATTEVSLSRFRNGFDNFIRYISDDGTKVTAHFKYNADKSIKGYIANSSGHALCVDMLCNGTPAT